MPSAAVASTAVSLLRSPASLKARKPWVGVLFVGGSLLEACLAASNLWTIRRLWASRPASSTPPG
jgi:hypothetical protein